MCAYVSLGLFIFMGLPNSWMASVMENPSKMGRPRSEGRQLQAERQQVRAPPQGLMGDRCPMGVPRSIQVMKNVWEGFLENILKAGWLTENPWMI